VQRKRNAFIDNMELIRLVYRNAYTKCSLKL